MTTSLALTWVGTRGGGHSTIMPERGTPRSGVEQPADAAGAADDDAAAVADSAPEAAAASAGGEAAPEAAPVPAAP
jgi:hypothetical protein